MPVNPLVAARKALTDALALAPDERSTLLRELLPKIKLPADPRAVLASALVFHPHLMVADLLDDTPIDLQSNRHLPTIVVSVQAWVAAKSVDNAPTSPTALPTPRTWASVEAWARRHEMLPYLKVRINRLAPFATGSLGYELTYRQWLDTHTALTLPTRDRSALPKRVLEGFQTLVETIAGQIAEAIAEEASTARPAPVDDALRPLAASLTALRASLREGTHPTRRHLRATYPVTVRPDDAVVRVVLPPSAMCNPHTLVNVDLPLHPGDDVLRLRCKCFEAGASCPARLAAVDRVLDVLTDPGDPVHATILHELTIPPWTRALARMERLVLPAAESPPLGWRLVDRAGTLLPEPVTFRSAKSGKGFVLAKAAEATAREVADDRDQRVLDELVIATNYAPRPESKARAGQRALRALVGHPHVFLEKQPVSVVEQACEIVFEGHEGGARVSVRLGGRTSSPKAFLASLVPPVAPGQGVLLDLEHGRVVLIPLNPPTLRALETLATVPPAFPSEALAGLLGVVDGWRRAVPVALAGDLRGDAVERSDRLEVRLAVPSPGVLRVVFRVRPLPGGEAFPPGEGSVEPFGVVDGRRVFVTRDLDGERILHAAAWDGLPGETAADVDLDDPEVALTWLQRLPEVEAVDLTWDSKRTWRVGPTLSASHVKLKGRDARSWFSVDGTVEIDHDAIPLSALLAAVRERRTYVPVGTDRWARLTDSLRDQVEALARGQAHADGLELSPVHLPLLDAMVRDGATLEGSAAMLGLLDRLRKASDTPIAVPSTLRAELRPYQQEGHRFLARLASWAPGAFLADDMGLGKTVQALALLLDRAAEGPALVVAPTSVGFNWVREAERFAPSLRVSPWRGAQRRAALEKLGPGDVIVTSYDLVQRDAAALAEVSFATVVLDEAQAIKNAATRRWKAVRGLQRGFTLALTGTPIENRLDELWALAAVVVPGLFGDVRDFRATWAAPVERGSDDAVRLALSRRIRPFLLRRTKASVAPELPERTIVDVIVPLEPSEQQLYDEVRKGALVELNARDDETAAQQRIRMLAALTALRRVACHPGLHDPAWTGSTSKLDRVRELVTELREEGHKALLFSQFVGHLTKVREALESDGVSVRYLDGSTPEATRRAEVDAFQRGEGDAFLISLKAGGTGLNLTAASYVLHLDPWWNPAVEDQATDRAHRIGQTRAVTVYRVVAAGTVEEQILKLHEDKRRLVAGVLEGTDAGARLGTDDLMALLRGEEPEVKVRSQPAPAPSERPAPPAKPAPRTKPVPPAQPAPAVVPPPPVLWTPDRLAGAVLSELSAEVSAGRLERSSAEVYRSALRRLLLLDGVEAALAAPEGFAAWVLAHTKPGPVRVVGRRAAAVMGR